MKRTWIGVLCVLYSLSSFCQYVNTDELKDCVRWIDSLGKPSLSVEGNSKTKDSLGTGGYSQYSHQLNGHLLKMSVQETMHYGYNEFTISDTNRDARHFYKIDTPNTEYVITDFYYDADSVFLIRVHAQYYDLTQSFIDESNEFYIPKNFTDHIYVGIKERKAYIQALIRESRFLYKEWKESYDEDEQTMKELGIKH